jgi:hypothetical protein
MSEAPDDDGMVAHMKQAYDEAQAAPEPAPAPETSAPAEADDDGMVAHMKQAYDEGTPAPAIAKASKGVSGILATDDYGTPYARAVAQHESAGNPNAHSGVKGSTATGLGQFIGSSPGHHGTWAPLIRKHRPDLAEGKSDEELDALRTDPHLSLDMIQALADDNTPALKHAGVPINDGTLYGAHHFGPETYGKIYHAEPTAPIESIIGEKIAKDNNLSGQNAYAVSTAQAKAVGLDATAGKDLTLAQGLALAKQQIPDAYSRYGEAVKTVFKHPGEALDRIYAIGNGLAAKLNHYLDIPLAEGQDKDEAVVDAMGAEYKKHYSTWQGFLHHLADEPLDVALDASTVLTGGGGALAKAGQVAGKLPLLGAAGDAVSGVGKAAATVGANINPLNPGRIVSRAVGAAPPVLKGNGFTPQVETAFKKRGLSGADLTPEQRATAADILQRKGISQPAVDEAILKTAPASQGLQAPKAVVTGEAPPSGIKEGVDKVIADNNEKIGAGATQLGGGSASDTDLAEALDNAHTASINRASGLYNSIRQIPGYFTNMDVPGLLRSARSKLTSAGIAPDAAGAAATGHPYTARALRLIQDKWGQRQTILPPNGSGAQEVLAMRQALSNMRQAADGSDVIGVGHVMDALDQTIAKQASGGAFVSPAGAAMNGQDLANTLRQAASAYRKHFDTFERGDPLVAAAVKQMQRARGKVQGPLQPLADPAVYRAAQQGLAKGLLDPVKGAKTFQNLQKAIGPSSAARDFVRSSFLNTDAQTGAFKPIKNAQAMLNDPNTSAGLALSPTELAQARHLHAAHAINNTKLKGGTTSALKGMLGSIGSLGLKGIAGATGYETLGMPGAIIGPAVESAIEHVTNKARMTNALKGAPAVTSRTSKFVKNAVKTLTSQPLGELLQNATEEKDREGHAAGGKVDINVDDLVDGLMRRWRIAKKHTDATTKPLLRIPDAAIVAALKQSGRDI